MLLFILIEFISDWWETSDSLIAFKIDESKMTQLILYIQPKYQFFFFSLIDIAGFELRASCHSAGLYKSWRWLSAWNYIYCCTETTPHPVVLFWPSWPGEFCLIYCYSVFVFWVSEWFCQVLKLKSSILFYFFFFPLPSRLMWHFDFCVFLYCFI